jgi:tripartite-type tricarboxylate transporter receptor subunit TctC
MKNAFLRSSIVAFVLALPCVAAASDWPARPVRLVSPAQAGSSADAIARALAEKLAAKWKQPVVIENRPGAGAIIGTEAVAKSPPDGYTLGWIITSHAINSSLHPKLPYDSLRDFAGVTLLYQLKAAIVVSQDTPVSTVEELVLWARKRPGQVSYASSGTGTGPHLLAELFKLRHGLDMQHVAYRGGQAALPDVVAGRVPVMFDTLSSALPQVRAGKLKLLAVVSDDPIPGEPDLPLLGGLLPRDALVGWNGLVVPAKTPRKIVAKLNVDVIEAVRSPEVQQLLARYNVQTITTSPEDFDDFIRKESARWGEVIKRARISLDRAN